MCMILVVPLSEEKEETLFEGDRNGFTATTRQGPTSTCTTVFDSSFVSRSLPVNLSYIFQIFLNGFKSFEYLYNDHFLVGFLHEYEE